MKNWKPYVVRQGDHLVKLAVRLGFDPDLVWGNDKNASLRERRPDRNMLCVGDILYVPPPPPAHWHSVRVGTVNRFVAQVPTVKISLKPEGRPMRSARASAHGSARLT